MTTLGLHPTCGNRVRSALALLIAAPLVALTLGSWAYFQMSDETAPAEAASAGMAPLQTLIFMHLGDVPGSVQAQP